MTQQSFSPIKKATSFLIISKQKIFSQKEKSFPGKNEVVL
nr:MAG TPA: hypothetical protein [Caudoviricetes sp.]